MKVALACHNFPPEFQGGTERVVLALAQALRRQGDDVLVITGSDRPHQGRDVEPAEHAGVPVLRLPRRADEGYGLVLARPRLLAVAADLLVQQRVEVLHLHHWATLSLRLLRRARELGLGTVVTLHDMWTTCPRFFRRPPAGLRCPTAAGREPCGPCAKIDLAPVPLWGLRVGIANRDREIQRELAAADAITAPSRVCADKVREHTPWAGPIEIVPHGLLEPVRREATDAVPRTPFRVGTFGNLVEEKGVLVLVEAMAGVGGAELHLFGRFLQPSFEQRVHALASERHVVLHCHGAYDAGGPHPARELDLAVFPSLCEETYGLVVEEALARGVPVVVSDLGALRERIGEGGVVVPAGDAGLLRAELCSLIGDSERYDRLRRGIPSVFATIDDAALRYRALYRSP